MKTSAWWGLLAVGLWSCAPYHKPVTRRATSHTTTTLELPSGMRVVIEERPGTRRVATAVLVGSGARQDPADKDGLAHFVEHLAYRSRPTNRLSMMDELNFAAGADVNALTTHDTTTFVGVASAARLAQFLPLFGALVSRPLVGISDDAFEVERNVVRSELFTVDDPHGVGPVIQKLVQRALPEDASGGLRALGGTPESLAALTRADAEAYVAANYRPENTTVVITGDVTAAQIKPLLPAMFSPEWLNAPASGGPRTPRRVEAVSSDWLRATPSPGNTPVLEAPVEGEHLMIAWPVPGKAAPGGSVVPLLVASLQNLSGKRVKSKPLSIDVNVFPGSKVSVVYLDVELPRGVTAEEASAALREKPLHADLAGLDWRALLMVQAEQEQELASVALLRADRLYNAQSVNGAREGNVNAAKQLVDEALTWERARELIIRPAKRTAGHTNGVPPPALQQRPPVVQATPEDFKAMVVGLPVGELRTFTLQNGLQVVLSRRTDVPLASVALTLPVGSRHVSRSTEFWLPYVLDWRINNDEMNRVGSPNVSLNADSTTVYDTELSTQLPVLLDWLGHFLPPSTNSTPGLFQLLSAHASWESTNGVFRRLPFDLLPADSRFRPFGDTPDDERQWSEMSRFLHAAWRPNGAALVVDGDLDLDATEKQIRELFTDWARQSPASMPLLPRGAAPRRDPWSPKLVSIANKDVSRVEFGCRLPPLSTPELRGGAELLRRALKLYFGEDLRGARGVTYGASVRSTTSPVEDNLLNLSLVVDARDNQAAMRRFFTLLDELDGAVWDDVLVDRARWAVARDSLAGESGSTSIAWVVSRSLVRGASVEEALNEPLRWSQTPIKWVDELWAACNDTYELRVEGDETTLEPLLAPRRK